MSLRSVRRVHNVRSLRVMSPQWGVPVSSGVVGVQSVAQVGDGTLQWEFTSPVSTTSGSVPQLQASGDGVSFASPTSAAAVAGGIRATYGGAALSPGSVYAVAAAPSGVTFAAGTLSLPQSGTVITPERAAEIREAGNKPLKLRRKLAIASRRAA